MDIWISTTHVHIESKGTLWSYEINNIISTPQENWYWVAVGHSLSDSCFACHLSAKFTSTTQPSTTKLAM